MLGKGWGALQTIVASLAILSCTAVSGLDLNKTLGDIDARTNACSSYSLPPPFDDRSYDIDFLGPQQNVIVGSVNYTYKRFGPLNNDDEDDLNNTLVLIVGSAASQKVWQADLLRILAEEREVVIFDLPGIGSNDSDPEKHSSIDGIAQSLLQFFDALNLDQPDVLGWSLGGYIALYLGVFYGDSVNSLVLVSTTAGGRGLFLGEYEKANPSDGPSDKDVPHPELYPDTKDGNEGLCRFLAFLDIMPGHIVTSDEIRNQSIISGPALQSNAIVDNLDNLTNPVLILHAESDLSLDFQNGVFLSDNINQSFLISRKNAGHAYILQAAADVGPVITEFLDIYDFISDFDLDFEGEDDNDDDSGTDTE